MEATTLDLKAYNLYYDYAKENNIKPVLLYYFLTYKESKNYNIYYKQALKQIRTKKLNNINNTDTNI